MSRAYRHTFYEVYVTRDKDSLSSNAVSGLISEAEWREIVERDEEIVPAESADFANGASSDKPAWKIRSLPEGTPIFFEAGKVLIREDDSDTIEKLVEIAKQLKAKVVGEDGTVFFEIDGSAHQDVKAGNASTQGVKIPIDDELVRKRQSAVAFVMFLIVPVIVIWKRVNGDNPGDLFLWGLGSLAMAGYAAVCFFKTKYYLLWSGGKTSSIFLLDTKSTRDTIVRKDIANSQLNPLELIWFPLEYPGKTKIEYHVRSQKLPWLVFLASSNKARSQAFLSNLSQKIKVRPIDLSSSHAAKNIPKKYQLTEEEKGLRGKKKKLKGK